MLITAYLLEKNGEEFKEISMNKGAIHDYDRFAQLLSFNQESQAVTEDDLMKYAKKLHNDLRDYARCMGLP